MLYCSKNILLYIVASIHSLSESLQLSLKFLVLGSGNPFSQQAQITGFTYNINSGSKRCFLNLIKKSNLLYNHVLLTPDPVSIVLSAETMV